MENIIEIKNLLSKEYGLTEIRKINPHGGTAGKTWEIFTEEDAYFLRMRGVRTSSLKRVKLDHSFRIYLNKNGIPVFPPLQTLSGKTWVKTKEGMLELYPFIEGHLFNPGNAGEIKNAARILAYLHKKSEVFLPGQKLEPLPQYTAFLFLKEISYHFDDPYLQKKILKKLQEKFKKGRGILIWCLEKVQKSIENYWDKAIKYLPQTFIHGDYTPANLLFSKRSKVVGIFDLDWVNKDFRIRDIVDGMYFFSLRKSLKTADIWSLTSTQNIDLNSCRAFLKSYEEVEKLKEVEKEFIPFVFQGRWLSIRIEGMAKVESWRREEFFLRDIKKPILWFEKEVK